jgi:Tfp pilus assembly protein PilF
LRNEVFTRSTLGGKHNLSVIRNVIPRYQKSYEDNAIQSYQEAVRLDPSFALAWARLSIAVGHNGWDPSPAQLIAVKDAADHAFALDPNLPETHLAVGYYRYGQRDYSGALSEFQQAEQGLPNNAEVIESIALVQRRLGHWEEAVTGLRRTIELRTSVMQYKGGAKRNLRQIANELGVAHVVEGSVQRVANRVRVSAQLIEAKTDTHSWANSYDRPLDDVFAIQSEIAKAIAGQLKAKLSPAEKAAIEQPPTTNLIAYDRYLRAQKLRAVPTARVPGDMREVIRFLDQVIAYDPTFLRAYGSLASAHAYVYHLGVDHTPDRIALAKQARDTALRLGPDPSRGASCCSMGRLSLLSRLRNSS